MKIDINYFDKEGSEVLVSLPAKFEVCHVCKGFGSLGKKRLLTKIKKCYHCRGRRVEKVIDYSSLSPQYRNYLEEYREFYKNQT